MSWLARSIANSLKLDDGDDVVDAIDNNKHSPTPESDHDQDQSTAHTPRGVKEDLSELTKSFSRQLWGVASFLAPPPQSETPLAADQPPPDEEAVMQAIKSDFAEIGGKLKSGISKLSNNINVSEITKMASNFLQLESEMEPTDDVLLFARDIALHPETWLDFPIPDQEAFDDFELSDAQQEHALAVERLVPRLAALRIELCPQHMSENCFWKIYFILLHPRLSKDDAQLLSTPQIVEARAMLAHQLKNRTKGQSESVHSGSGASYLDNKTAGSGTYDLSGSAELAQKDTLSVPSCEQPESVPLKTSALEFAPADSETEKHPVQSTEMQAVDKSVIKEEPVEMAKHKKSTFDSSHEVVEVKFEDHDDDWLKEENSEMVGVSGSTMHLGNDEDVSFSDLEEEDDDIPTSYKKVTSGSDSSTKDSRDWVQLTGDAVKDIKPVGSQQQVSAPAPKTKESNDWLDFDDIGEI